MFTFKAGKTKDEKDEKLFIILLFGLFSTSLFKLSKN